MNFQVRVSVCVCLLLADDGSIHGINLVINLYLFFSFLLSFRSCTHYKLLLRIKIHCQFSILGWLITSERRRLEILNSSMLVFDYECAPCQQQPNDLPYLCGLFAYFSYVFVALDTFRVYKTHHARFLDRRVKS